VRLEEGSQGSEIERLKAEVAALQQQLEERDRREAATHAELDLLRTILDQVPMAVLAVDLNGEKTFSNRESKRILEVRGELEGAPEGWSDKYGAFLPDGVTPCPTEQLPLVRAMGGEVVRGGELCLRNPDHPEGVWLEAYGSPLVGSGGDQVGALVVFLDNQERKSLEDEVASRTKDLMASESEKTELIARLRMAVQELSTPILELWEDVLALPVIGVVDSRRSAEMMERLLDEIVHSQSRFVIIDLTGVEVIDTSTADHFMKLVKAVGLIGARCVLTGIRPAVAQTLVDLDVNFGQLETLRNLKHGLRYCLRWLDAEDAQKAGST
jgi:rsbT co-antagonist protein RsbR